MRFLPSILPTTPDRWVLSAGSMVDNFISLPAGENAYIILVVNDILYIPNAFQIRMRQNVLVNWKEPTCTVTLTINYEDGTFLHTRVPLNSSFIDAFQYVTENVTFTTSKNFTSMFFTIHNDSTEQMDITLFELRPSVDLDEGLAAAIEALQTQLVYTYNEVAVDIPANTETIVIRSIFNTNRQTALGIKCHFTGTCSDSNLSAFLLIDGAVVQAFPLVHTFNAGYFYYAIPSLIPEVTAGEHNIVVTLISSNGDVHIDPEKVMLAIEGRGVLGAGGGTSVSIEQFDNIPFVDFDLKFLLDENYNISLEDV